jgi:hypothetical protein
MKGPSSIDIVAALPPPGRLRKPSSDDGDGKDDEEAEPEEEKYSEAEDSMKAFMEAVKGDDVKAALEAFADVKSNC